MSKPDDALAAALSYFNDDELAASTFISKYALKEITEQGETIYHESSPDQMHERLAREFARIERNYPHPRSEEEIFNSLAGFFQIVPQGSPMYGVGNPYVKVSLSNCIVVESPEDSVSGIMKTGKELANLFKRRAGVGVDISSLRPDGSKVSNAAGTSTGAWSFAEYFSNVCRMIGQNGRRGALMITIDVNHPDVEKFAVMKRDLTKVTGANVSILISDDFMEAVEADGDWVTQWPINVDPADAKVIRVFKARELWRTINESAWMSAEPGLIFADNYRNNLPAHFYPGFEFLTVNPCSEIGLSAYDACRLISLNLKGFVLDPYSPNAQFDWAEFKSKVALAIRLMDDLVDLEVERLTEITEIIEDEEERALWQHMIDSAIKGRRVGLGTHGLADMFIGLGIKYDSDEALAHANELYRTFRDAAYNASIDLAVERGSFPLYDHELEKGCEFIKRLPAEMKARMKESGRRNISLLTMAPTGSVSILSQTSSGIEPVFQLSYTRRKKINPSDPDAEVDFVDASGDKWQEFTVEHHALREWKASNGDKKLPAEFVTAPEIDTDYRVRLQGIIQSYIDHGISSTLNLPEEATVEQIEKIYIDAWRNGLKGVTVYRDGSRSGVLISHKDGSGRPKSIIESYAPERPETLPCELHHVKVKDDSEEGFSEWTFIIGFLEDKPYEIFGGPSDTVTLPKSAVRGTITKRALKTVNRYDLTVPFGEDHLTIRNVGQVFSPPSENYGLITRFVSQLLRHGVPVEYIHQQITRSKLGMHEFAKVLGRVLKDYIKEGAKSGEVCTGCGSKLIFQDGCFICLQCGASKCS